MYIDFLLVQQSSLEKAKSWVKELQRQANSNIVIAFVGNKIDLVQPDTSSSTSDGAADDDDDEEDSSEADDATATPAAGGDSSDATAKAATTAGAAGKRQVSKEEAQAYAQEAGLLFAETSAKTGEGVVEVFTEIGMPSSSLSIF